MDGTILNSLCLLTHIYESIQPSLFNGTSAGKAGKKIEKVLIVGRNGRRLLLEDATIEQIQKILEE